MRIKKRLQLNVAVSVITSIVICLMLFITLQRITSVSSLTKTAGDLMSGVLDRVALRNDYIRNNSSRAKEQWFAKHEQISALLTGAAAEFRGAEDRKKIAEMIDVQQSIGRIFSAIVANREKEEKGAIPAGLAREVEDRLLNQLNMRVYEVAIQSRDLLESARKARSFVFRQTSWEIIAILLLLIAAAMLNSRCMEKEIADRVARLRKGVAMIGDGDLEHRIDIRGDDELAELAESFNAMTAKLSGSYRDLENEIEVRKRVEEEVKRLLSTIQEEKERLSCLVNGISDEVWFADMNGKFTLANPSAIREFGLNSSHDCDVAALAASLEVFHDDGSPRPVEEAPPLRALAGEVIRGEDEIIRTPGSGELRHRQVSAAPVRNASGEIIGSVSVARDITERRKAEEAFSRSQKTFAELVERAPFGIYVVDSQFRIAQMNAGSQSGAFRNARPVIGRDFAEAMRILWPEPVAADIIGVFRHTLDTGEPYYSPRFINPRHDVAAVESYEWELHRITLADGQYGVICYYFDSTKLREAEEALRRSEERLRLAHQVARIGSFEWDLEKKMTVWSAELEELHGLQPGTIGGRYEDWAALVHPDDLPAVERCLRESLDTGLFETEWRIVRPDGTIRCVAARGQVFKDDAGKPLRMVGVNLDITERKHAEEALRAREADLNEAQRLARIGSWYWDAKTDVTIGSDELLRIYGIDPATQTMPNFQEQRGLCYPVEDWERVNAAVQRSLETGIGYELDVHAIHNGKTIWVTTRSEVMRDADNRIVSLRGTVQDITDRKEAEQALGMAHDELAKLVEERTRELHEKEVLLKEIHHRVKNNLQVISSLVSLQGDGSRDETVREVLRDVTDRVRSMALVHEKLYQSADLAHVDFAEYSRSLLGYLWRAHGSAAAAIRLSLDLAPVSLPVDTAVPLGLVLNELAGNALKHAFRGRSEGEVTVALQGLPEGRISLRVADDGVGFPEGLDWRQANSLGLRLVQMLAGQLGANVELNGGEGTKFEITFGNKSEGA